MSKLCAWLAFLLQRLILLIEGMIEGLGYEPSRRWETFLDSNGDGYSCGSSMSGLFQAAGPEALCRRARQLASDGRIEKALKLYVKVLEGDPDNSGAMDAAAELLAELGDVEGAKALLDRSIELAPEEDHAKFVLLGHLEHGQSALAAFEKGLALLMREKDRLGGRNKLFDSPPFKAEKMETQDLSQDAHCKGNGEHDNDEHMKEKVMCRRQRTDGSNDRGDWDINEVGVGGRDEMEDGEGGEIRNRERVVDASLKKLRESANEQAQVSKQHDSISEENDCTSSCSGTTHGRDDTDSIVDGYSREDLEQRKQLVEMHLSEVMVAMAKVYLTDCFNEIGSNETCESILDTALLMNPDNAEACQALADLRLSQDRRGEALLLLKRTLDLCSTSNGDGKYLPSYDFRLVTGRLLVELSQYHLANEVLEECAVDDPEDTEVFYLLGLCHIVRGKSEKGHIALKKAKSLLEVSGSSDGRLREQIDGLLHRDRISEAEKQKFWNPRWWVQLDNSCLQPSGADPREASLCDLQKGSLQLNMIEEEKSLSHSNENIMDDFKGLLPVNETSLIV